MVRPIVGLLLAVATRCNCDGIARGLSARSQAEEELLVRMLTLQHQQMAGDRPLDSLSAIVSEAHGGADAPTGTAGALVSPWAHELAASTVVPVVPRSMPARAFLSAFRAAFASISSGKFEGAQQLLYEACLHAQSIAQAAAHLDGRNTSELAIDPDEADLIATWSRDCATLVGYVPAQMPLAEDHKRMLMLLHDLAAPLLFIALVGRIDEALVDVPLAAEIAQRIADMGEVNRRTVVSLGLHAASQPAPRASAALEALRRHEHCTGEQSARTDMFGEIGVRLCALLFLRTGQPAEAVSLLKRAAATSPTLHFFFGAFALASRLPPPPLPPAASAAPPSRFTTEQMLEVRVQNQTRSLSRTPSHTRSLTAPQVLDAVLAVPIHGLSSEANLLRWHLLRMLDHGHTRRSASPLACPPPAAHDAPVDARILIVVPFVAAERERLTSALRRWAPGGGTAPCVAAGGARGRPPVDLAFYLSDAAGGPADAWARDLPRADGLLGGAVRCFGRVELRHANLSAAEQYYIGGWDNTGPNNLFSSVFDDDAVHAAHDFVFWMEADVVPVVDNWLERLREEAAAPRGFWRKGPIQQPRVDHAMVSTHHYHMNSVGLYRLGQPCFRELMRRVAAEHPRQPHDVSTYLFLHDPSHFHIFQQVAHRFLYTDFVQNRLDEWDMPRVRAISADTAFVHGKKHTLDAPTEASDARTSGTPSPKAEL